MDQIGRYQILGELGRGAMGVVYRAQDPAIGRIVAIKTIRLSDLTDPGERERLRDRLFREAQTAGILSHPNIVTIYDIAEENEMAYVFMEYVDGPPLERLLAEPIPPSKELILGILRQTASALDYAHSKGIVHRDIKPANIMLHEGRTAKVTDFGVAKILSQQMSQSGAMMGTPNYMSPEQVQGHSVDGRADQFSLAVVAYEILTGEKPFVGEYLPTLLYKIVREDPVAPQRLNPTLGPQLEVVLRKALAKNPEERYANCSQFASELAAACEANSGWQPLARGSSQTMPTLSETAGAGKVRPGQTRPVASPAAPVLPPSRPPVREDTAGNPLIKSLIWMLVGIGLVGLVLLGSQRFLFNRALEEPQAASAPAPAQAPPPSDTAAKPSPMGNPDQPVDHAKEGAKPRTPAGSNQPDRDAQPGQTASRTPEIPQSTPDSAKPGVENTVQFLTDPPEAQIVIDSNPSVSCKTPCMLSLPPGRHVLHVQLDGYRTYPKIFNVPQDSDVFLQLSKSKATLSITSSPPGATIQLNGEEQKTRTPAIMNVAPGSYHVRVTKDGVPFEFDVTIKDGEFINKNVAF